MPTDFLAVVGKTCELRLVVIYVISLIYLLMKNLKDNSAGMCTGRNKENCYNRTRYVLRYGFGLKTNCQNAVESVNLFINEFQKSFLSEIYL